MKLLTGGIAQSRKEVPRHVFRPAESVALLEPTSGQTPPELPPPGGQGDREQFPSFSVAPSGASALDPATIYQRGAASGSPQILIPAGAMGLVAGDDITSLSYGSEFPVPTFNFSTAPGAIGNVSILSFPISVAPTGLLVRCR